MRRLGEGKERHEERKKDRPGIERGAGEDRAVLVPDEAVPAPLLEEGEGDERCEEEGDVPGTEVGQ